MLHDYLEDELGKETADIITKLVLVAAILILTWVARRIITIIVSRVVPHFTRRTQLKWDDDIVQALQPPARFLVGVIGLWIAILVLELPQNLEVTLGHVENALIAFGIFWGIYRLIDPVIDIFWALGKRAMSGTLIPSVLDQKLSAAVKQITRAIVILLGFTAILETWGYDVAGVVAGFGLGGLAVALAAQ